MLPHSQLAQNGIEKPVQTEATIKLRSASDDEGEPSTRAVTDKDREGDTPDPRYQIPKSESKSKRQTPHDSSLPGHEHHPHAKQHHFHDVIDPNEGHVVVHHDTSLIRPAPHPAEHVLLTGIPRRRRSRAVAAAKVEPKNLSLLTEGHVAEGVDPALELYKKLSNPSTSPNAIDARLMQHATDQQQQLLDQQLRHIEQDTQLAANANARQKATAQKRASAI
eukprot:c8267_g1_i1.p1 GENE.c8267_g1_i1~~c8267_g1_i1.p1  ORF type:complete len:221 (-),score=60.60 c8267_g1_i1:332-994(-)